MNDEQLLRYSRHILLPNFDIAGQQRVLQSRVLIIGLGGLGSPVALYLAAAGVGHLVLVDDDIVELTNLQRQIVHRQASVGQTKTHSAVTTLQSLNDTIKVEAIDYRLNEAELSEQAVHADVIVDCTDNFSSRFLLNRVSKKTRTPLVSAAAIRWEGQVSVYDARQADAPCYRCLYDDKGGDIQQSCAESGVLSPLLGMMGSIQAIETLKLLADTGTSLNGRLLMVDALSMQLREMTLKQDPACPVCHDNENR
ncbi:molybdopterin-synthase adenylyltransferase MoeB [Methylophaga nitratireducenticrescens]|uniref:Molybdopterin-synthase adenylyltransferase n=1 Tax=Methylophaga nitratireducenticrescens TaxID=754476 RepID=I1XLH8_METNJ|nr:molybdopterin-synthase adenylyltransferase MoeB [Methylophaga nitratireducenticrescens]AFI85247.1 molybdopterin-synthase adenylyltransferase MoeB [Methylophaga nitratireducenticrescens]